MIAILKIIGEILLLLILKVVLSPLRIVSYIFKIIEKVIRIIRKTINYLVELTEEEVLKPHKTNGNKNEKNINCRKEKEAKEK